MFNTLTDQVVLTSRSLLEVYIGIVKCYPLCCSNINKFLIMIQTLFPIDIYSKPRIITQDIITRTVKPFKGLLQRGF
jgi:hypothetical protein